MKVLQVLNDIRVSKIFFIFGLINNKNIHFIKMAMLYMLYCVSVGLIDVHICSA